MDGNVPTERMFCVFAVDWTRKQMYIFPMPFLFACFIFSVHSVARWWRRRSASSPARVANAIFQFENETWINFIARTKSHWHPRCAHMVCHAVNNVTVNKTYNAMAMSIITRSFRSFSLPYFPKINGHRSHTTRRCTKYVENSFFVFVCDLFVLCVLELVCIQKKMLSLVWHAPYAQYALKNAVQRIDDLSPH